MSKPRVWSTSEADAVLARLADQARAALERMTPEERRDMYRRQAEAIARAVASWPSPRYTWRDGVKVYPTYEDYLND